jgi:hypothetical protein
MNTRSKKFPTVKLAALALGLVTLAASAKTTSTLGDVPLYFEAGAPAQFVASGSRSQFLISPVESQIILRKSNAETATVRMRFTGANPAAQLSGEGELSGKINYFTGGDPAQWRSGVPTFARVRVEGIYPGINLVYYGNQKRLEYDFAIAPGANPDVIAIRFDGMDKISVSAQGELVLKSGRDEIRQPAPAIYQTVGGALKEIGGGYKILDPHTVAFTVGQYDRDLPLVIDPILGFATYFGGTLGETAWAVALNTLNTNIYIAGQTFSKKAFTNDAAFASTEGTFQTNTFSTEGAFQTNFQGGKLTGDGFIARFDNTGTNLIYLTYLGGSGDDFISSVAVDAAGNAFVTGFTDSTNFPTTNALYSAISGKKNTKLNVFPGDAFVAELDPSGSNLVYSTYLGGSGLDSGNGIAVDSSDNAYVTGTTESTNFPETNALAFQLPGSTNLTLNRLAGTNNAFVTEIASNGTAILFSTYLGGNRFDVGEGIAVDADNSIYVTGFTSSTNFPVFNYISEVIGTNSYDGHLLNGRTNKSSAYDAFVTKFEPFVTNLSLAYSTYLGGTNNDFAYHIAYDDEGSAYVTGSTESPNFPNLNTITGTNIGEIYSHVATNDPALSTDTDAFLTKIDTNGAIVYSAIFGGKTNDVGYGVAVDAAHEAFVVGSTSSKGFPVFPTNSVGFLRATNSGDSDVFVIGFGDGATTLLYSTYLGGGNNDYGYGIAVNPATGDAYVVGQTASKGFALTNAFQPFRNGTNDAFLLEIQPTGD